DTIAYFHLHFVLSTVSIGFFLGYCDFHVDFHCVFVARFRRARVGLVRCAGGRTRRGGGSSVDLDDLKFDGLVPLGEVGGKIVEGILGFIACHVGDAISVAQGLAVVAGDANAVVVDDGGGDFVCFHGVLLVWLLCDLFPLLASTEQERERVERTTRENPMH